MANIFDDLEVGKSVFKDKQPLDHRFLPENLPHRKEQITQIAKYWIEALNNVTPSDITIYGKTGTGKTAAAKFAREQLNEAASNKNVFIKVEYIRCTDYTTEYQVIAQLCQKLGRNVPHRGWTKGEVINTFRDIFRRNAYGKKLILIVILARYISHYKSTPWLQVVHGFTVISTERYASLSSSSSPGSFLSVEFVVSGIQGVPGCFTLLIVSVYQLLRTTPYLPSAIVAVIASS